MKRVPEPRRDFVMYVPAGIEYIEREPIDSLTSIYGNGYLPYSGTKNLQRVFYRARSARVRLQDFTLSSENRRIAKKFDEAFSKERIKGPPPSDALDFCLAYFAQRHGPEAMPAERLEVIFAQVTSTEIYRSADKVVAYIVFIDDADFEHYWYSFYDLTYARQSLGMWLMLDAIRDAKAAGKTHMYLGTVYGEKALYKTNFEPLEWWDGSGWKTDLALLKSLSRSE